MSKKLQLAQRIRGLKIGQSILVQNESERQSATKIAKTLRAAGVIEFGVITRKTENGGFTVAAIP